MTAAWDITPASQRLMHPPDLPVPAADLVHACAHELITCQEATGHVKRHLGPRRRPPRPPSTSSMRTGIWMSSLCT